LAPRVLGDAQCARSAGDPFSFLLFSLFLLLSTLVCQPTNLPSPYDQCFFYSGFCDIAKVAIIQKKNLAKFGYNIDMIFKN
jgi:hypothetical protein